MLDGRSGHGLISISIRGLPGCVCCCGVAKRVAKEDRACNNNARLQGGHKACSVINEGGTE